MLRAWLAPLRPAGLQQKIANTIVVVVLALLLGLGSVSLWFALQQQQQALQRLNAVSEHWLTLQLRQQLALALYPLLPEHPGRPSRLQSEIGADEPPGGALSRLGTWWAPPAATRLQLHGPDGLLGQFPATPLAGEPAAEALSAQLRRAWQGQPRLWHWQGEGHWLLLAVPLSPREGEPRGRVALLLIDLGRMLEGALSQFSDSPDLDLHLASVGLSRGLAPQRVAGSLSVSLPLATPAGVQRLTLGLNQPDVVLHQAQTALKVLMIYLLAALAALLLTRLLANRLAGNLVQRLKLLANASRAAGIRGQFLPALPASDGPDDELTQLQSALVYSYARIEALNANLEQRVARRTRALKRSEARYRLLAEHASDIIAMHRLDGRILYVSPSCERVLGYTQAQLRKLDWLAMMHPADVGRVRTVMADLAANRLSESLLTYRLLGRHGEYVWMESQAVLVQAQEPATVLTITRDIQRRVETEAHLRLLTKVFSHSSEGIMITDENGTILEVNQSFVDITQYSREEAQGQAASLIYAGTQALGGQTSLWQQISAQERWEGEVSSRRKDGRPYPQWLAISQVRDADGQVSHYIGIFTDITERKQQQAQIAQLAYYDQLTGLPNRTLLMDRIEQMLTRARRSQQRCGLLFIDLDHFKAINDSLGHDMGDRLLQGVAQRLQGSVRQQDTVARLGGDEFIIALEELHEVQDAVRVAEEVLAALDEPIMLDGKPVRAAPSIGIAIYPDDGQSRTDLLRAADSAMYQAKASGRHCMHRYSPHLAESDRRRITMEEELRKGLASDQFSVVLQPQFDMHSGLMVGAEALLRWQSPILGRIPPLEFIPCAEQSGQIQALGDFILQRICTLQARWQALGLQRVPVFLNLSTLEFLQPDLLTRIQGYLQRFDLPGSALGIEIREQTLLKSSPAMLQVLDELRREGVQVVVDDFGTGCISLSNLRFYPVDTLKIDRSFVEALTVVPQDMAIARTIVELAKGLKLTIIAEGVESSEQEAALLEMGCLIGQGYLYAKPLGEDEFTELMHSLPREGRLWRPTVN